MNTDLTKNQDMERIYMQLLRDTETSIYYLRNKFNQTERQINRLNSPIKKIKEPSKPQFRNYFEPGCFSCGMFILTGPLYLIVCLVCIIDYGFDFSSWLLSGGLKLVGVPKTMRIILATGFALGIIPWIIKSITAIPKYIRAKKEYKKEMADVKAANLKITEQMKNNHITALRMAEHKPKIKAEYEKAVKLRNDLYGINWIPSRYRNIRVIYYICDMVLTSNIGIEEALKYYLLQEANNKLDKVLQKMDEIIENQNEIIVNQAVMNAQNERIIQQNTSIISHAEQIEENTRVSEEYAQIGARYAEANAYFSAATYLKMK